MIRMLLAGASKSHICQKMVNNGYAILLVCPTNKLSHVTPVKTNILAKHSNFFFWAYVSLVSERTPLRLT